MEKNMLVTGATSGFGKAIAEKFAAGGWNCIITGRRKERLEALATTLSQQYPVKILPLVFDVQDRKAVFTAIEALPVEWKEIDLLVNNAGLALGKDSFDTADLNDWEIMLDTNVKGVMYVTKAVLPVMLKKKKGHIINMGSVAGKLVYKEGNGYCASKHALDALSKSMRIDLLPHRIRVTAIHPGAAETEFSMIRFKGDEGKARQVYEGFTPLHASDVADVIYYCANLPENICINDLTLSSISQADGIYIQK